MNTQGLAALADRADFQKRIQYLMVKAAIAQLNGSPSPESIALGQRVLRGQESVYLWSVGVLTNPSIASTQDESGASIPDGDLEFATNSLWPAFSA